jgi:hypothetical protein
MSKFIIKDFKKWLKEQPEDRAFNEMDSGNCYFAAFLKETGQARVCCVGVADYAKDGEWVKCPNWSKKLQRSIFTKYNVFKDRVSIKEIREACRELKIR